MKDYDLDLLIVGNGDRAKYRLIHTHYKALLDAREGEIIYSVRHDLIS